MANRNHVVSVDLVQSNDPSNPDAGYVKIVAKPDDKLYLRLPSGAETEITNSAGSGAAVTELRIDNGNASTTFTDYVLRMDFGTDGASINPTGTP